MYRYKSKINDLIDWWPNEVCMWLQFWTQTFCSGICCSSRCVHVGQHGRILSGMFCRRSNWDHFGVHHPSFCYHSPLACTRMSSSLVLLHLQRIYLGMFSCEWSSESLSLVLLGSAAKHFQNLSVSSELVLATVCPSGLSEMWRILWSWPERSATRVREGVPVPLVEPGLQMERWLCGWPWEERSSRWCEDHRRPLIYREKVEGRYFRHFQSS